MGKYRVNVLRSLNELEGLSTQWNDLLVKSGSNTIFLTWEWLYSWAECFLDKSRELFVLTVHDGEKLVGIAPWYISKTKHGFLNLNEITFLGVPEAGSDYLDVISLKEEEKDVAITIYEFLLNDGVSSWDILKLHDLQASSLFLLHFHNMIQKEGKYAEVGLGSFCPFITLPKSEDDFLNGLSAHRRAHFRRNLRVLEKDGNVKYQSYKNDKIEPAIEDFTSFYKTKKGNNNETFFLFLKKVALRCKEKNWIQIDSLCSITGTVASLLHFKYQNNYYQYSMVTDKTFNPKVSLGDVLVGRCIEKAIGEGAFIYDFLKGAEDHKFRWANAGARSINFYFYNRALGPIVRFLSGVAKNVGKILLR